jgi:hypothetical protein
MRCNSFEMVGFRECEELYLLRLYRKYCSKNLPGEAVVEILCENQVERKIEIDEEEIIG